MGGADNHTNLNAPFHGPSFFLDCECLSHRQINTATMADSLVTIRTRKNRSKEFRGTAKTKGAAKKDKK